MLLAKWKGEEGEIAAETDYGDTRGTSLGCGSSSDRISLERTGKEKDEKEKEDMKNCRILTDCITIWQSHL